MHTMLIEIRKIEKNNLESDLFSVAIKG